MSHLSVLTNGLAHLYHLGESTCIFRGTRSDFIIIFNFSMKFYYANRIAPDGMPQSSASLGLYCLSMSYKIKKGCHAYMSEGAKIKQKINIVISNRNPCVFYVLF